MPEGSESGSSLAELERRLAALRTVARQKPTAADRVFEWIGATEAVAGFFLLILSPFDSISLVLTAAGFSTLAYERLYRQRRERRLEVERRRSVDLLLSEIDRLKKLEELQ
jgi:hypothetical protein